MELFVLFFKQFLLPNIEHNRHYNHKDRQTCHAFAEVYHIVADDHFQRCGREFADKVGNDIVPCAHAAQSADGGKDTGRKIRQRTGEGHPDDAVLFAGLIDVLQTVGFPDQFFRRVAEEETHQQKAQHHAGSLRQPGNGDAQRQ